MTEEDQKELDAMVEASQRKREAGTEKLCLSKRFFK